MTITLVGQSFGALTVIDHGDVWVCRCACGAEVHILGSALRSGKRVSCIDCMRASGLHRTHSACKHPTYTAWAHMKDRCFNPRSKKFKDYGARGITVCDEWRQNFEVFHNWSLANGWQPGLTIDRIDNDGSYYPENCRWVTHAVNNRNTRKTKRKVQS